MNLWDDREGKDDEEDKKVSKVPVVYKNGMPSLMKKLERDKIPAIVKEGKKIPLKEFKQNAMIPLVARK